MKLLYPWLLAIRPKTLLVGLCPVYLGCGFAWHLGQIRPFVAMTTILTSLLIQIACNMTNDYYDFIKGADTAERVGPTRVSQAGLIRPETMKHAIIAVFSLAFAMGMVLVYVGGWTIFVIGILSLLSAYAYTGGPCPLAYLGLGDVFAFMFFGPIAVGGSYFLQSGYLSTEALILGLCPGAFSVAMLAVNNVRDLEQDRKAAKQTLVVRLGKTFGRLEYTVALLLGIAIPMFYFKAPFLGILFLPAGVFIWKMWHSNQSELNPLLAKTAVLLLLLSLLFSYYLFT